MIRRSIIRSDYIIQLGLTQQSLITCPICRQQLPVKKATLHHLIPSSLAPHLYDDLTNVVFLCQACHWKLHRTVVV